MARFVELRRHTDNDGDLLSARGVADALRIGAGLLGGYEVVVSSGAQRATQSAACFVAGLGSAVPLGVVVETGLRSRVEDDWRAAYRAAGAGDLASLQAADPDLVRADAARLADGLRSVFDLLSDSQRALAVGHSPTNEAAVYGLTGVMVDPLAKGAGVVVVDTGDGYVVEEA